MKVNGYIQPKWPVPQTIKAFTTTRKMRQKLPVAYEHFNLATHVGDHLEQVRENQKTLQHELALPEAPVWLNQVHSNHIVELNATSDPSESPTADASFTKAKNTVCAVLTADCLPLVMYDSTKHQVAAVHAGWRGLHTNIIAKTIEALNTKPNTLFVWLGPAISGQHYAVGNDLYERFVTSDPEYSHAFRKKGDHWFLDLYQIALTQLRMCGVTHVFYESFCTYRQQDLFYSYRRDGQQTGRIATLIYREGRGALLP